MWWVVTTTPVGGTERIASMRVVSDCLCTKKTSKCCTFQEDILKGADHSFGSIGRSVILLQTFAEPEQVFVFL